MSSVDSSRLSRRCGQTPRPRVAPAHRADSITHENSETAHWLYDGTRWWSYDDPIEVARKMRYVIANRLGGAMMWSLDGDDARGRLTATIDRVLTAG